MRKINNHRSLEVISKEEIEEETHYARATTDTAFKIMMSDLGIAQALVNSLFEDISDYAKVK
ncbi:MAG: hypothetical protein LBB11_03445, partial [Puniceicoccales bacterium]|nr:hypothetical protein [Puniceicoccales bacterium]